MSLSKTLLAAAVALAVLPGAAHSVQITAFGQTSANNTVFATTNAAQTQTTISAVNALVDVTQLFNNSPYNGVDFNLSATSVDAATQIGTAVLQHYTGNFCITTSVNCGGTNLLSGVFTDAAFGGIGGPGLVINVNSPPDSLSLTSSVISATDLDSPNSFGLTLSNLTPTLHIAGTTIAAFNASLAGTASSSSTPVTEPESMLLLGVGLVGLGMVRWRSQRSSATVVAGPAA